MGLTIRELSGPNNNLCLLNHLAKNRFVAQKFELKSLFLFFQFY